MNTAPRSLAWVVRWAQLVMATITLAALSTYAAVTAWTVYISPPLLMPTVASDAAKLTPPPTPKAAENPPPTQAAVNSAHSSGLTPAAVVFGQTNGQPPKPPASAASPSQPPLVQAQPVQPPPTLKPEPRPPVTKPAPKVIVPPPCDRYWPDVSLNNDPYYYCQPCDSCNRTCPPLENSSRMCPLTIDSNKPSA